MLRFLRWGFRGAFGLIFAYLAALWVVGHIPNADLRGAMPNSSEWTLRTPLPWEELSARDRAAFGRRRRGRSPA
jgi:hypothetical protein